MLDYVIFILVAFFLLIPVFYFIDSRILLTRIEKEGALPAGLTTDPEAYDEWFRAKVKEAMEDTRPRIPHAKAMAAIRKLKDDDD